MQGYITLATGSRFYLEMAVNLLLSLKLNDPSRPVCLITDRTMAIPDAYKPFIDDLVYIEPKPGFFGCLNKLRLNELTPYDETIFIDADCILVKNDMDRHWAKLSGPGFNVAGAKKTTGKWYDFSIDKVISELGIPYLVQMNSGVFYFRKGVQADNFFATALQLVDEHKHLLGSFHRNKLQLADEPFIGAALGKLAIEPVSYKASEGTIMITTWHYSKAHFDPIDRHSTITRHADYRLLGHFFPKTNVLHSPSIAHFVKLKPKKMYNTISDKLRDRFKLDAYPF